MLKMHLRGGARIMRTLVRYPFVNLSMAVRNTTDNAHEHDEGADDKIDLGAHLQTLGFTHLKTVPCLLFEKNIEVPVTIIKISEKKDVVVDWLNYDGIIVNSNEAREVFSQKRSLSRLLLHLNSTPMLRTNVADCLSWNADPSGIFSASSAYHWFELGFDPTCMVSRSLWKATAPPRAQFFGWLVWRGKRKIKTASFVRRIGILNVNVDVCCVFAKKWRKLLRRLAGNKRVK
ncbi:unnamed protein product [Camellia sinensis]